MAETISMPKLGFDMAEGTLVRWVKKEGETVNKGEVLAEIETDKATVEVESLASGVVRKLLVDEGSVVPVNTPIAVVGTADEKIDAPAGQADSGEKNKKQREAAAPYAPGPASVVVAVSALAEGPVKASPLAKKIARESKVDLAKVVGTGPGGRIVRRDIEAALAGQPTVDPSTGLGAGRGPQTVGFPSTVDRLLSAADEVVPLSKLRLAIARRMTESKTTIPHFYVTHEYKVDSLLDLRRQFNAMLPEEQKVSVNDFIVRAVALTLRQFPNLNSSISGNELLRHGQVNVGVAVAVEGGLLTVVCKDADRKPLAEMAAEVKAMAARARAGKVRPDDIEGSTFSISNLGMFDVESFIAIVNPPEAAILAVGSAREVPVVVGADGCPPEIKTGWRMKATLSVDHRVSDGAEAARFMQALAVYLEEPLRLVM